MEIIYALMFEDVTSSLAPYHCFIFLPQCQWFWLHVPLHPAWAVPVFFTLVQLSPLTFLPFTEPYPDWSLSHLSSLAIARTFEWSIKGSFNFSLKNDFFNWSWGNDRGSVTWWRYMCNSNLFSSNVVLQPVNILPPKEGGQIQQEQ